VWQVIDSAKGEFLGVRHPFDFKVDHVFEFCFQIDGEDGQERLAEARLPGEQGTGHR
jgi:hypothetical protein